MPNYFHCAHCGSTMKVKGDAKRCTGSNRKGKFRYKGCGNDRSWSHVDPYNARG